MILKLFGELSSVYFQRTAPVKLLLDGSYQYAFDKIFLYEGIDAYDGHGNKNATANPGASAYAGSNKRGMLRIYIGKDMNLLV